MVLLNVRTGVTERFPFPSDIFDEPGILSRIQIKRIAAENLVIRYHVGMLEKSKSYRRKNID